MFTNVSEAKRVIFYSSVALSLSLRHDKLHEHEYFIADNIELSETWEQKILCLPALVSPCGSGFELLEYIEYGLQYLLEHQCYPVNAYLRESNTINDAIRLRKIQVDEVVRHDFFHFYRNVLHEEELNKMINLIRRFAHQIMDQSRYGKREIFIGISDFLSNTNYLENVAEESVFDYSGNIQESVAFLSCLITYVKSKALIGIFIP